MGTNYTKYIDRRFRANRNITHDDLSRQKYKKSKRQIMFDHEQIVALNWTA